MIGNLEKLKTLDLKYNNVTCIPKKIVKLVRLRHLLCNDFTGFKAPSNIGALLSLQKLSKVKVGENGEEVLREIGRLSELRKLVIVGLRKVDGITLWSSLSKLTNLRSLDLDSFGDEVLNVESLPTLPFLERFTLRGRIDKALNWKSFPSLIKVRLEECRLMDGDSLCFKAGGFQRLKHLEIDYIDGLKTVTIEEGTMPHLDTLRLWYCELLDVVPFGIEHLTKLRHLRLLWYAQETN